MRGEQDDRISCFCRDAIAQAQYIYVTYLISSKDQNLNGPFLSLVLRIHDSCGSDFDAMEVAMDNYWKWDGPEVVRTYPTDEVIKRVKVEPMQKGARTLGRWVPYTVQLVYRDKKGQVMKTENYSSREFIPDFDAK